MAYEVFDGTDVIDEFFHIPTDLVVDQGAPDVESSSHRGFLLPHYLWTTFLHLMKPQLTPTISMAWNFTTKSGGI